MLLSKREKDCVKAKHLNEIWREAMLGRLTDLGDGLRPVRSHFGRR